MFPAVFKASKNVYLKIDRVHQIQIYHQNDYHLVMTNSSPWKDPPFLIGKPSFSMGHLYHGYVK